MRVCGRVLCPWHREGKCMAPDRTFERAVRLVLHGVGWCPSPETLEGNQVLHEMRTAERDLRASSVMITHDLRKGDLRGLEARLRRFGRGLPDLDSELERLERSPSFRRRD